MSDISKGMQKFHLIYSIVLSISITISGLLFIFSCINIYLSGKEPFSRESVAAAFSLIAIPVYICILLVLAGIVINFICDYTVKRTIPPKDYRHLLKKLYLSYDVSALDTETLNKIESTKKIRKNLKTITLFVVLVSSCVFLIYALNSGNFHQTNINDSMIKAMLVLIPCLLVSFIMTLICTYKISSLFEAEINLVKQAPRKAHTDDGMVTTNETPDKKTKIIKYVILAIALVFIVYGLFAGGTLDVLTKAVNICTECIGLG